MKELKEKKHLIIGVLSIVIILGIVIKFIYQPTSNKKAILEGEIATMTMEDIPLLNQRLQEETQRGEDAKNQLDELYKMKKFGYLDYTKMMDYLGEKATETDIDIITLSKVETRQNGKHYEVPYYVTLKGKYENLLMFVDSLYQIENYMQINAFQINQKASSEEKNGTTNDNSSNYEQWMNTFAQRLNKDLKTEKVKENTTTQVTTVTPSNGETQEVQKNGESYYKQFEQLKTNGSDILDLEMEVMFISMDPVEE